MHIFIGPGILICDQQIGCFLRINVKGEWRTRKDEVAVGDTRAEWGRLDSTGQVKDSTMTENCRTHLSGPRYINI